MIQSKEGYVKSDKPLSPSTIRYHHAVINGALKTAESLQMIGINPARKIELPKVKRKEVKILSREELACMIEDLKDTPHYVSTMFALSTGMRRGEIYGLRWQDVDLAAGVATVRRTIIYKPNIGTQFKESTKSGKNRRITIPPRIIDLLKQHKQEQGERKKELGSEYMDLDLVFCRPDGKPQHPDTVSSWFTKFTKRRGFENTTFHKLRHTHLSYLMEQGITVKAIQERAVTHHQKLH